MTRDGYIKRQAPSMFKTQSRGGKGVIGLTTKEQDVVEHIFSTNTHADILFFTTQGRVFQLKAYDIPAASRTAKGQALVNFLQLGPDERVSEAIPLEDLSNHKYLVMVTRMGIIKKVDIQDFAKVRRSGLIAIRLRKGDNLEWVKASTGKDEIILVTSKGQSIRFKEKDVRPMGRNAAGVRGIRLKKDDQTVGYLNPLFLTEANIRRRCDESELKSPIQKKNTFIIGNDNYHPTYFARLRRLEEEVYPKAKGQEKNGRTGTGAC
jgi:DNA gyrase subunit A